MPTIVMAQTRISAKSMKLSMMYAPSLIQKPA
jgi:hypothetical protein